MRNENPFKKIISSKIFFLVGLVALGLVLWVLSKKIIEGRKIDMEIREAEEEITRLEAKNSELNDFINYLNTESFLEEEARLKFDLQKPGESVLIIPETAPQSNTEKGGKREEKEDDSNIIKWWNYFFDKD